MSNKNDNGFIPILAFILYASVIIISGAFSWKWVEPKSFVRSIGFIFLWGILSYIGHFILLGITAFLSEK